MQYSYALELKRRAFSNQLEKELFIAAGDASSADDGSSMMSFLIECAPVLAAYEKWKSKIDFRHTIAHYIHDTPLPPEVRDALQQCHQIHLYFLQSMGECTREEFNSECPSYCPSCLAPSTLVDVTKEAAYVCTKCYISHPYSIPRFGGGKNYADIRLDRERPGGYIYNPLHYLKIKIIQEAQGIHSVPFPPELLRRLSDDFLIRTIPRSLITPKVMRTALRHIKSPQYYYCRWALTKHFNPAFEPIRIPEDTQQQLHALFLGMTSRFPHIVRSFGLTRKNLPSYPTFVNRALLYLNLPDLARTFAPLKSFAQQQLQNFILDSIFAQVTRKPSLPKEMHTHPNFLIPLYRRRRNISKNDKQRRRLSHIDKHRCDDFLTKKAKVYRFTVKEKRILMQMKANKRNQPRSTN